MQKRVRLFVMLSNLNYSTNRYEILDTRYQGYRKDHRVPLTQKNGIFPVGHKKYTESQSPTHSP